ncbi:hypothetical protein HBI62_241280 [Parastagonospora nodorum]|nr:hypothetical protein HBI62_241280 [Parastagonospora nodorum]KAH6134943.1 hypothetical protein HBI63_241650 [Parastagonospora nodorum]KAH6158465.1 hypothetical protein HBI61_242830 [Parastagonospora nodorum]
MLTVTPIKDNNNLLNTIDSHIKLRKLKEKHLKVREVDALKQIGANVREERNKNYSSLYYSNSNSDTATRKTRIKAYSLLDSNDYCLDSSPDIDSKDNLEDEEATIAKDLAREQKERLKALLNAKIRDSLSARVETNKRIIKLLNKVVVIDPANSILCDLSNLLVIRFCIFSNPALENISILTNKKVVEMQTNTATALANELAAVNKLFALVCSFRKVDRHVFRANNTISVTAQRIITQTIFNKFYNCKLEGIIIAKFYKDLQKYN